LILINDIWLGLAILDFCFLSCITVLMVESIHAVIQEGSAAEEPSWALAPLGPKVFLRPRCRDELSLWSVVGMPFSLSPALQLKRDRSPWPEFGSARARLVSPAQASLPRSWPTPELRIPNAAAQTRIVSKARIRLDSGKSVRSFKGIICDISEFESYMPSHAVGFLWSRGYDHRNPRWAEDVQPPKIGPNAVASHIEILLLNVLQPFAR
jgi:hypothetical protein